MNFPDWDDLPAEARKVAALAAALREQFCPWPVGGDLGDADVGECVDRGECGCGAASGLAAHKPRVRVPAGRKVR